MYIGNLLIKLSAYLALNPPLAVKSTKIFNPLEISILSNFFSGKLLIAKAAYSALYPHLASLSTKVFNAIEISI